MDSHIVVDTNPGEDSLFNRLTAGATCEVKRQRLDVGDIMLSSGEHGRYKEQKARQLAALGEGDVKIVYIVQGELPAWNAVYAPSNFKFSQMEAAIVSTSVRDGIPVLRAKDGETLAETVLYLYKRFASGQLDLGLKTQERAAAGYAGAVKVKKAKNMEDGNVWRLMLATVPGLSASKADVIYKVYPTPAALVDMIRAAPAKAIKTIAAIECGSRKLGPVVAGRLVQSFS